MSVDGNASPPGTDDRPRADGHPRMRLFGVVALVLVLLPLYLWSIDIRASRGGEITGDEPFYLMSTRSLLDDGDPCCSGDLWL